MDSGERGREPVGEMGRSQFPDHGADARPAAAVIHPENQAFPANAGTSPQPPFIRNKRLPGGGLGRRPIDGGKTTVIRLICF